MARTNNLTNFLTDVATAIKTKTGDSTAIPASQFDTKILGIQTGHLDNTEYAEANDDLDDILEGSTPTKVFPPDWSEIGYEDTPQSIIEGFNYAKEIQDNWDSSITNLSQKFYNSDLLKFMPMVDTSKATNTSNMFYNCINLMAIPLLNISDVKNTTSMFYRCRNLIEIPHFDVSSATKCTSMFSGCSNLKTVPNLNISKTTDATSMFLSCTNLSNESLNNIMEMCINAIKITSNKTLKNIGLTQTQTETCQSLSNYQAFLDAGWTTGY